MYGKGASSLLLFFSSLNFEVHCYCGGGQYPIITTPLGNIKGSTLKSRLGKTIYSFRGIRYAKPPINELRFRPPVPVEKWEGTYDATKDGVLCPQPRIIGKSSEDCLILNIYTTELPTARNHLKRPVIIYIPTGAFYYGGSTSIRHGPNYLTDQDIVLVTFNFRIASLVLSILFTGLDIGVRCYVDQYPIVTTPLGKIKGSILESRLGKTIYSFRGIRYGKPPINELRFQPPVPIEKWEGVYDATKDGLLCPQPRIYGNSSEDCLTLNVYTTKLPSSSNNPKRPVIIHAPSGRFVTSGSRSTRQGPQYFLDQDIVLITFNFRLATLGFLSTGDKYAPGNNGLKDQVELLKWVKNNIESFGGDPKSVTLTGYSAGGCSALLHMVSPMSQGLFHKAVSMSGFALAVWQIPTNLLELARKQARLVGCPDDSSENIVKCLKTVPAEELGESLGKFQEFGEDPTLIWGPVIEGDFGQHRFLSENPYSLIMKGKFQKIPFMVGQTRNELENRAFIIVNNASLTQEMNENFERVAPISFLYERNTSRSRDISRAIKKFYLHDRPVDKSQVRNLGMIYADAIEGFFNNRAAKLIAEYGNKPVYYYCFAFEGQYSNFYLPDSNNMTWGVVHLDDLMYLLYDSEHFPMFGKDSPNPEADMVELLTTIYANFARTGNPLPHKNNKLDDVKWDSFTLKSQKYMEIGKELIMKERLYEKRFQLWEKLFPLSMYRN